MQIENKPLVVYFSATGTTAQAARTIADVTGGALYEIEPEHAYTSDALIGMTDSRAAPLR